MTSAEISNRLNELNSEKKALELELENTLAREAKERTQNLFNNTKAAIKKLWELYWNDEDNTECGKRLDEVKEQYRLNIWLEADIKAALKKSNLEALDKIKEVIKDLPKINIDKCIKDAQIRLDFASALRNVKKGEALSGPLEYGFGPDDLMQLMELHKTNKFRKKIEDLLTDCNFHSESTLLSARKYDEYITLVLSET